MDKEIRENFLNFYYRNEKKQYDDDDILPGYLFELGFDRDCFYINLSRKERKATGFKRIIVGNSFIFDCKMIIAESKKGYTHLVEFNSIAAELYNRYQNFKKLRKEERRNDIVDKFVQLLEDNYRRR